MSNSNSYPYQFTFYPPSTQPSTQPTVTPSPAPSVNPSEKPVPKKPVRIIITQFDQPIQTLDPSANLNEAKIHLNFDKNGVANVRFQVDYDYFGKDSRVYYVQYKLKQKPAENVSPTENQTKNVKILVLKYFPLDTSGNKLNSNITLMSTPLSQIRAFVDSLNTILTDDLTKASKFHGYKTNSQPALTYTVIENKEFLGPIPVSSNRAFGKSDKGFRPDYRKVLNDVNICDYVDNKGVSQVWIWGYHTKDVEIDESNMSMGTDSKAYWNHGDYGDISNSEQANDLPTCKKTYVLYNYNYSRSVGEGLEDHGHQIEVMLRFIDYNLFWNNFVKPNADTNGISHCGWMHIPPNVQQGHDYDWVNKTSVQSDCEDWKPEEGGQTKDINCHT